MIDISQLSRFSGFPASKIRYYEEIGLIQSVGRRGLKRLYESDVETHLALISLAQTAGFSLREVKAMISAKDRPNPDHTALAAKADAIDTQIKQLTALRNGLRHVTQCTADDQLNCPRFKRIMRATLKKYGADRKKP